VTVTDDAGAARPATGRFAAYLFAFVLLGMGLSAVGPALGHLRERSGVGIGLSGLVLGGQSFGYIVGSLVSGRPYDRGHGHRVLVAGTITMAVAMAAASFVTNFAAIVLAFVLVGAGAALVDVGGNTLVVWSRPPATVGSSLNALHLCFGIGALMTPVLVARSLDWSGDLVLVPVVLGLGALGLAVALRRVSTPVRASAPTGEHPQLLAGSRGLFLLVALFFFLYVGAESTMAGWVSTYGESIEIGGVEAAGWLTSMFFAGFTLGRVVAIWVASRVPVGVLVVSSCLGSMVAALALGLGDGTSMVVWAATFAFGFFLGPQYASMMAVGDERLRLSGSATSLIVAASGFGGLVLPVTTGWVLDGQGADSLPWALFVASMATTAVALAVVGPQPASSRASRASRTAGHSVGRIE